MTADQNMPSPTVSGDEKAPFAVYVAGDAYSTAKKIMGRQSAGQAFLGGLARRWPDMSIPVVGPARQGVEDAARRMKAQGYRGRLQWTPAPHLSGAVTTGCLYYPALPTRSIAMLREQQGPAAFSIMGVTHTLSSSDALRHIGDLVLPPFRPWDAVICTSRVAVDLLTRLQDEMAEYYRSQVGLARPNRVQLPLIPLGVDVPAYRHNGEDRAASRDRLGLAPDEVAFLFAGRMTFHAKANPAPVYQALQKAAGSARLVCIEAGITPNAAVDKAHKDAQATLAPDVRFVRVDGTDAAAYKAAWRAADVFVSLSDNIQETFGLTPVEAMAAGLPVLVSDWNGYKDTVRNGVDGFRVPSILPPVGAGGDLAQAHIMGSSTYDMFIGRASLATVVAPPPLAECVRRLATDAELRAAMGAAGRERAATVFDWPVILGQYAELAGRLGEIRRGAGVGDARYPHPEAADPFHHFRLFPSATLQGDWRVMAQADAAARLAVANSLTMINYGFDDGLMPQSLGERLLQSLQAHVNGTTVAALLNEADLSTAQGLRALMWLWKFDIVVITN